MKQDIRFNVPIDLGKQHFEAEVTYSFIINARGWLEFAGQQITSLSAFANWFTDRGQAEFIDAAAA